ncbi:flagellar biosynthesis anti-sigma factor protein FlgM [Desulfovibrio sp. X2]|uniref:flagellar biosynthesis anti-sigma factor FlgM n=1 Tax=Desulfovibrio sp. X2 TaxID=941449 RepID=UPI0003588848|nr:flagellar biosynthesis anti-sigma factor FlgM [Desulfovibrio sp. X2]EPR41713.1 flagellar biosynthesis anti-sigma factor protein FlgM [Desulfovibrio sp. X2]
MEIKNLLIAGTPYDSKKIDKAERNDAADKGQKSDSATGDKVSLSSEGTLRSLAVRSAGTDPDVRAEKIADLKARIKDGTYQPDNKKIAEGIVREDLSLIA